MTSKFDKFNLKRFFKLESFEDDFNVEPNSKRLKLEAVESNANIQLESIEIKQEEQFSSKGQRKILQIKAEKNYGDSSNSKENHNKIQKKPKISPKSEKFLEIPKKVDPDRESRPFGMLPIRHIDELFEDFPSGQLNEELDYHPTVVITNEPDDHQQTVYNDDEDCVVVTFKCDLCPRVLNSEKALENHKTYHNFECKSCDRKFVKERQLINHTRDIHDNPGQFRCFICSKKFNRKSDLHFHEMSKHARARPKVNKCPTCGYECDSKITFKKHLKTHLSNEMKTKQEKKPKIEVKDDKMKIKTEKKVKVEIKNEKKVFKFKAGKNEKLK